MPRLLPFTHPFTGESGSDDDALHKKQDGGIDKRDREREGKKKEGKGEGERVSVKRQRRDSKEERRARKKSRREEKRRKADHAERALSRRGMTEDGIKDNERDNEGKHREKRHEERIEREGERPNKRQPELKGTSYEDMFRAGSLGVGSEESRKKRIRAQERETSKMDRREYKKMQKEKSRSWRERRDC